LTTPILDDEREANGEILFKAITNPYFGSDSENFRATMAILISEIYYLNMYTTTSNSTFCGIDAAVPEGQTQIKNALNNVIEMLYKQQQK